MDKLKCKNVMDTFATEKWKELSNTKKETHSLKDCNNCLKAKALKEQLSKFPINNWNLKAKANKAGLFKEKVLADITNQIVNNLDAEYQSNYRTTFTVQAKKHVPSINQEKLNKQALAKEITNDSENQYRESDVDR